tara:strand:+ start:246 stop:992 length:747 start_codon:yes stop_codon:yes gene_type:complete
MIKPIVAGNWKMHKSPIEGKSFINSVVENLAEIKDVNIIFCPPFTGLNNLNINSPFYLGAQNCYYKDSGAFTGEISLDMLLECGVNYIIVGHSERRHIFNEGNELIRKKIEKVISVGVSPIFCIGETLEDRNNEKAYDVIEEQLESGLEGIKSISNIVVAYEPVWAIGTGLTASVEKINDMHSYIRKILNKLFNNINIDNIPIIYGGSVNTENADELISIKSVNGFLIGGASLDVVKFVDIVNIVNNN